MSVLALNTSCFPIAGSLERFLTKKEKKRIQAELGDEQQQPQQSGEAESPISYTLVQGKWIFEHESIINNSNNNGSLKKRRLESISMDRVFKREDVHVLKFDDHIIRVLTVPFQPVVVQGASLASVVVHLCNVARFLSSLQSPSERMMFAYAEPTGQQQNVLTLNGLKQFVHWKRVQENARFADWIKMKLIPFMMDKEQKEKFASAESNCNLSHGKRE